MKSSKLLPKARLARRQRILAKRIALLALHVKRGKSYVQRGWSARIYPHSSKRQRARYERQNNAQR